MKNRGKNFLIDVKLAFSISEELLSNAKDHKIDIEGVYLKATDLNSFDVLFLVDDNDEDAYEINKAYIFVEKLKTNTALNGFIEILLSAKTLISQAKIV